MSDTICFQIEDRLYLNITNSCTLECTFCPKTQGVCHWDDWDLHLERRPDAAEVIAAVGDPTRYAEVVFCGFGEPTLRLNVLLEIARELKARGGRIRVVTDGLANLVHDRNVLPSMAGAVDALSVSLNAQDAATYEQTCRPNLPGSYAAMRDFLREAPRHIPEVTATAIEGFEAVDIAACEQIASAAGVTFRKRTLRSSS